LLFLAFWLWHFQKGLNSPLLVSRTVPFLQVTPHFLLSSFVLKRFQKWPSPRWTVSFSPSVPGFASLGDTPKGAFLTAPPSGSPSPPCDPMSRTQLFSRALFRVAFLDARGMRPPDLQSALRGPPSVQIFPLGLPLFPRRTAPYRCHAFVRGGDFLVPLLPEYKDSGSRSHLCL